MQTWKSLIVVSHKLNDDGTMDEKVMTQGSSFVSGFVAISYGNLMDMSADKDLKGCYDRTSELIREGSGRLQSYASVAASVKKTGRWSNADGSLVIERFSFDAKNLF